MKKKKKNSHENQTLSLEHVKHIKCDVMKSNIQCIIKLKNFNKTLKSHNRMKWLIPSRSVGCSQRMPPYPKQNL